jgi:uncharacterized protein YecA (UPF0149 family)
LSRVSPLSTPVANERRLLPEREAFSELLGKLAPLFYRLSDDEIRSVGRNDPCPCGSGKKFKRCHGR